MATAKTTRRREPIAAITAGAQRAHMLRRLRQFAIHSTLLPDGRSLTQEMIAATVGVHPAAVSRVINGSTVGVGRELEERIRQEICKQTGRSYVDLWQEIPLEQSA